MWTLSQVITGLLLAVRMKYTFTNSLTYEYGNIQTWTNCRLKIAYCYGLRTWTFDKTRWTDVDQSLTIRTLLLT